MSQVQIDSEGVDTTLAKEIVDASPEDVVALTLEDVLHALPSQAGGVRRTRRQLEEEEAEAEAEAAAQAAQPAQAAQAAQPAGAGPENVPMAGPAPAPEETAESEAKKQKTEPTLTQEALANMVNELDSMKGEVVGVVDKAAATLIGIVPSALKAAAVGGATTVAVNNPSMFAWITGVISRGASAIATSAPTADWTAYQSAVESAARSLGAAFEDVSSVATSPWFVFTSALLVMRFRASSQGKTVTELMKEDGQRLKAAATAVAGHTVEGGKLTLGDIRAVVEAQAAEFTKAYAQEPARQLGELARRVAAPEGEGAVELSKQVRAQGFPAVQLGPTGEPTLVTNFQADPSRVRAALGAMAGIRAPPKEQAATEELAEELGAGAGAGAGAGSGSAAPMDESKGGRRRRRRTKRKTYRKKKGVVKKTRARRSFIY